MSNSPLVSYVKLSPCNSGQRTHAIDRITPHVVVGQLSVETIGACFDHASVQASCNYGIGSDGRVMLCVEENKRSWCSSNSANDQRAVTIECASDKTHPYAINNTVYNKLIELCVDICRRNGKSKLLWLGGKGSTAADKAACEGYTPKSDEMILTAHRFYAPKACPGDYVYSRLGAIAAEVTKRLGGKVEPIEEIKYKVRLSWDNPSSQLGAYIYYDKAVEKANENPGYTVYDLVGKALYTSPIPEIKPGNYPKGIPANKEAYIEAVGTIAQQMYKETKILPSVVAAQCCLETGFGLGSDSVELMKVNNLLGMKTDLISSTWKQWSVWNGESISKRTPEYYNGKLVYITDSFRKYTHYENCIRDYEMFLLHVRNDKGLKYARVAGMTDPAQVIHAIRIGTGTDAKPEGYCTDYAYEGKIMNLIKQYNLTRFDSNVTPTPAPQPIPTPAPAPTPVMPTKTMYRVQVGVFSKASARDKLIKKIKKKLDLNCFYEQVNGLYYTYCGSFGDRNVAVQRVSKLKSKGFDAFIKAVKI